MVARGWGVLPMHLAHSMEQGHAPIPATDAGIMLFICIIGHYTTLSIIHLNKRLCGYYLSHRRDHAELLQHA